jgi:hypothetical protein
VSKESTARFGAMAFLVELALKQVCRLQLLVRNSSEYTGRRTQIQCVTSALCGCGLENLRDYLSESGGSLVWSRTLLLAFARKAFFVQWIDSACLQYRLSVRS